MSAYVSSPRVLVEVISTTWIRNLITVFASTGFISLMAQVAIPLPFTPVPLTGQTLAVLLVAAGVGAWRAISSSALYLLLAIAGFPVLTPQNDGSHIVGFEVLQMASFGYVIGFIFASFVVGKLAEKGFSKTILRTTAIMLIGNLIIYSFGLLNLKIVTFADWYQVFQWGLFPFLIGDLLKIVIAANLLPATWRLVEKLSR